MEIHTPVAPVIDHKFSFLADTLLIKPVRGSFNRTPLNVVDTTGKTLFKIVDGDSVLINTDRLILDYSDSPVALLRHKRFSWKNEWEVYKGNHATKEAALFKVKKRKDGLGLKVTMASDYSNHKKKKMMGNLPYVGGGSLLTFYVDHNVVAYVSKKSKNEGGTIEVLVNVGTDCSYILAVLVIYGEMVNWKMNETTEPPLLCRTGADLN